MIKFGVLDFDTSHVGEFTKRLNHLDIDKDQWVEGGKVVIGCPGESKLSPERIPGYVEAMKKMNVPLVDKPEEMIGKVDAMLIEAVDGSVHWERARPFLEAGIPCYIDKPFTCSVADARKIIDLAEKKKVPVFSCSSLRYAPELVALQEGKSGKVVGAQCYGPASLHPRNPGLFHYGIHTVEILYTLMGPGCKRVTCTSNAGSDLAVGEWADGRIATVRGVRQGPAPYGATVFTEKGLVNLAIGTKYIYRELLKEVVKTFETGKPPVPTAVTLEIVGFIEAALKSSQNHGAGEMVLPV